MLDSAGLTEDEVRKHPEAVRKIMQLRVAEEQKKLNNPIHQRSVSLGSHNTQPNGESFRPASVAINNLSPRKSSIRTIIPPQRTSSSGSQKFAKVYSNPHKCGQSNDSLDISKSSSIIPIPQRKGSDGSQRSEKESINSVDT